jgi:hypothetical protein
VPIEEGRGGRLRPDFALQRWLLPLHHKPLTNPIHRIDVHPQHLGDGIARQRTLGPIAVAEKQNVRVANLLRRGMPVARNLLESFALLRS